MNLLTRFLVWLSRIITESSDRACEVCGGPVEDCDLHYIVAPCCKACGRRQKV